jgi:hypothetical protein
MPSALSKRAGCSVAKAGRGTTRCVRRHGQSAYCGTAGAALSVVLSALCAGRAAAVDANGTWALCLSLESGSIGCPASVGATLLAAADEFSVDLSDDGLAGTCVLSGAIDPDTGEMVGTPSRCFGSTLTGTATDASISGSILLGLCVFAFEGVRECGACADGNACTSDGCGVTACAAVASACTYGSMPNVACDDGDACTSASRCTGAYAPSPTCIGTAETPCTDGNPCTDDACDPLLGCAHQPNGAPCDDANGCTVGDLCAGGVCTSGAPLTCEACERCNPLGGCLARPRDDCRQAAASARTRFRLVNSPIGARDRVTWQWRAGDVVDVADFGDPLSGGDYTLCVYDGAVTGSALLLRATAPGGGTCPFGRTSKPCWSAVGASGRRGFRYRDGGVIDPDGVARIRLVPGGPGRGKIALGGAGENLDLPPTLAVDPPVSVQLHGGDGCWESVFTRAQRNREDVFEARGP